MIRNHFKYKNCPECDGKGYTERIECTKSASECCGGCFKEETCYYCDGDREFVSEYWENKVFSYKQRFYRPKVDVKYWRLSCGISLDKIQFKLNQDKSLIKELYNILKP